MTKPTDATKSTDEKPDEWFVTESYPPGQDTGPGEGTSDINNPDVGGVLASAKGA